MPLQIVLYNDGMSQVAPPIIGPQLAGLTSKQAAQLLQAGKNNIQTTRSARPYSRIILENVFSFFNILLFSSIAVVVYAGGSRDVIFPTSLLLFNISLSLIQEIKARKSLDKLSMLSQHSVTARRDGHDLVIPIQDIVSNDLVVISPGQTIVVDGPVLLSNNLEVNESSLTGESHDIAKRESDQLTSGSYCTAGSGIMQAGKIGPASYINRMAQSAKIFQRQLTPVQKRLNAVLRYMIIAIAIFAPLTLISGININLGLTNSIENMISLLTSLVPQGLIASVAILYTYGAIRISRSHTLVQRINAVESIGAVTVLCTDKTGTLTENKLAVHQLIPLHQDTPEQLQQLIGSFAASVSTPNGTTTAMAAYAPAQSWHIDHEVAFKSQRKWSGVTVTQNSKTVSYILGAPEVILSKQSLHDHQEIINRLTSTGLRVIALIQSSQALSSTKPQLPTKSQPVALIVLGDQVRTDVQKTLADFYQLGIQVKVISGDNLATVQAIAAQSGLTAASALTQSDLEVLDQDHFDQIVSKTDIFARITPDMKQKIIESLKKAGEHVAMIGDGVNDVPALKQANASIAMNSGAQIAKDVADVVLLNNAFSTLPKAIAEGRDISQRIYAIAKIFLTKAIYLMILFVLAGFASIPFPIDLRQTTLLGFVITGLPIACIAIKIIDVSKPKDPAKDFLIYTILGGVIGGLALAYLSIVTFSVFNQPIEVSKTMITIFAIMYSSCILWQVSGITIWDFLLVRRTTQIFLLCTLTVIAIGVPALWFPSVFHLVPLGFARLLFLAGLALLCAVLLQYFTDKLSQNSFLAKLHQK